MVSNSPCVATIGNFDGVHLGHQQIIEQVVATKQKLMLTPIMITFEPLPQAFFKPHVPFIRLMNLRQKVDFVLKMGIEKVWCLRFNEKFSKLSPHAFIEQYLQKLNVRHLVVGEDFRFGYQKQGDVNLLKASGFDVEPIAIKKLQDKRLSSTSVRQALFNQDLPLAKQILGRNYSICERVVKGAQRGRLLGFPTANCKLKSVALQGVFATHVFFENKSYSSITNVGFRPTVDGKHYLAETHILDFSGDLYGKRITVEFLYKIRDEKRFDNIAQLRQQIALDIEQVVYDKNRL